MPVTSYRPSSFYVSTAKISQLSHTCTLSSVDTTNDDSHVIWQLCVPQQENMQKALFVQAQSA